MYFKCSTHFVRQHLFVVAAMVLWKLTWAACEDLASERFLDCRKKTSEVTEGRDQHAWKVGSSWH